nr:MAG TPA: hypothetical protein [Caudoviricetes sp.]
MLTSYFSFVAAIVASRTSASCRSESNKVCKD